MRGEISIEIPPGALKKDTKVTVMEVPEEEWPDFIREMEPEGSVYRLEPSGLVFNKPVTVELQLEPDEFLTGNVEDGIPAYVLVSINEEGEQEYLSDLETKVSINDGLAAVSGELIHFSFMVRKKEMLEVGLLQVERKQPMGKVFKPSLYFENVHESDWRELPVFHITVRGQLNVTGPLMVEGDDSWVIVIADGTTKFCHPKVKCLDDKGTGVYTLVTEAFQRNVDTKSEVFIKMVLDGMVECVPPTTTTTPVYDPPTPTSTPSPTSSPTPIASPAPSPTPSPTPTASPAPTASPTPAPSSTPTPIKMWEVYIEFMEGFHICDPSTGICNFNVKLRVVGDDPILMEGATVTVKMTGHGITEQTKSETTDVNGETTISFRAPHSGVYQFEVMNISGEDMVYHSERNVVSSISIQ
ncbi:hypothetical protein ACFLWX_02895 [Chloroflexota bacterium]